MTDETDRGMPCPQNPDGWEGLWWGTERGDGAQQAAGRAGRVGVGECHRAQQVQERNVYKSKDAFEGQCGAWLNKSLFNSLNEEQIRFQALPMSPPTQPTLPTPVWTAALPSPDERLRCTLWRH